MNKSKKLTLPIALVSIFALYMIAMVITSIIPSSNVFELVADSATVQEDQNVIIDVLANDITNDLSTLNIESVTQGTNGTVNILTEDLKIRYTPKANFHGVDTFTYTVKNIEGVFKSQTVTVTVVSVNDIPVAENDTFTMTQGGSILMAVMTNDSDADGDTLVIDSIAQQPSNGVATIEGDTIRFTPTVDFVGSVTLYYIIRDGQGGFSNSAKVTIQVQPAA
ncbi:MAG: Ig-like domain-containing protein [bacterium]|jgi:hypothetical protein|nr:Ig-like domain-containing protein [bacterium]